MDPQGRVVQLADFQSLRYGELDGEKTQRVEALDQAFRGAGFDSGISEQILQDMWQKWMQLASLGAITCLLRGNVGEIVAVPRGAELCLATLGECAAVATACPAAAHPDGTPQSGRPSFQKPCHSSADRHRTIRLQRTVSDR